jgi:hypothetical protein
MQASSAGDDATLVRMVHRLERLALALSGVTLASCAIGAQPEPVAGNASQSRQAALAEPEDEQATAEIRAVPPATNPAEGRFRVHEWGLVVTEASGALAIATGSPQAAADPRSALPDSDPRRMAPAKPVFYVHLDDGLDEARFTLGVRSVSRGRVIEHFPLAVRQERNTAIVWEDVIARRGSCQGVYPGLADPLCVTPDGLCELAELSDYETREAACLSFGEQRVGLLFYRMDGARDTLPLDVRRGAGDTVRLRSVGAPPGGLVMRIHRASTFSMTRVRTVTLDADGRAVIPARAQASGLLPATTGLTLLSVALDGAGLTEQERDAFLRAWRVPLFGVGDERTLGAGPPPPVNHPLGPVADALLYFWPAENVDAALPLTISPTPREVRRVFVVRVDLGPLPVTE